MGTFHLSDRRFTSAIIKTGKGVGASERASAGGRTDELRRRRRSRPLMRQLTRERAPFFPQSTTLEVVLVRASVLRSDRGRKFSGRCDGSYRARERPSSRTYGEPEEQGFSQPRASLNTQPCIFFSVRGKRLCASSSFPFVLFPFCAFSCSLQN